MITKDRTRKYTLRYIVILRPPCCTDAVGAHSGGFLGEGVGVRFNHVTVLTLTY